MEEKQNRDSRVSLSKTKDNLYLLWQAGFLATNYRTKLWSVQRI